MKKPRAGLVRPKETPEERTARKLIRAIERALDLWGDEETEERIAGIISEWRYSLRGMVGKTFHFLEDNARLAFFPKTNLFMMAPPKPKRKLKLKPRKRGKRLQHKPKRAKGKT